MAEMPAAARPLGSMFGHYARLLQRHGVDLLDVPVHEGATPAAIDDCDGWVISGSPASVNDDLDWIRTGEELVRAAIAAEVPLVGVCFGHQLVARALGGRVERAGGGWGIGAKRYTTVRPLPFFPAAGDEITLLASHQDQVVELPPDAEVWSTSDYCPIAGMSIGERAFTVQGHPEYSPSVVAALYESRRDRIGDAIVDSALTTLGDPLSTEAVADAIVRFVSR